MTHMTTPTNAARAALAGGTSRAIVAGLRAAFGDVCAPGSPPGSA